MAFDFQKSYGPAIEQQLRQYYQSLSEKDRRRFAAIEAITLGYGGIQYIAQVLGCDPQTVHEGMRELKQLPEDPAFKGEVFRKSDRAFLLWQTVGSATTHNYKGEKPCFARPVSTNG